MSELEDIKSILHKYINAVTVEDIKNFKKTKSSDGDNLSIVFNEDEKDTYWVEKDNAKDKKSIGSVTPLYRVYRKDTEELLYTNKGLKLVLPDVLYNKDIIVEPCIGIKDSKGTDVYENDVVKYISHYGELIYSIVEWSKSDACYYIDGILAKALLSRACVVGNIHDFTK